MSDLSSPAPPAVGIGQEARPPTVVLPEPQQLFARRAARFRALAPEHPLEPYLRFLGDLTAAQDAILPGLPPPALPDDAAIERAVRFEMPAMPRDGFVVDATVSETMRRLFDAALDIAMPKPARAALGRVRLADDAVLGEHVRAVLGDAIPMEAVAEHVLVGAALQVHFARAAAALAGRTLHFIGDGVCPVCGAPPATSGIVGWNGADGTRFCTCSLCATRWNAVRVKCLACSSTKGIHYQAIEGVARSIRAECCDTCRSYVKLLAENEDPALDPIADDVASLGLDRLVQAAGHARAGVDLFLVGV